MLVGDAVEGRNEPCTNRPFLRAAETGGAVVIKGRLARNWQKSYDRAKRGEHTERRRP